MVTEGEWQLRWSGGRSRRVNSVWPRGQGGCDDLLTRIIHAEEFYRERDAPTLFQLSRTAWPPELERVLAARNYVIYDQGEVQVAPMDRLIVQSGRRFGGGLVIRNQPDRQWCVAWSDFAQLNLGDAKITERILQLVELPSIFVSALLDGELVGVGRGVASDRWVGVFNMATKQLFRNIGVGSLVIAAVGRWGKQLGCTNAYLQVEVDNVPAKRLYREYGFEALYRYGFYRSASAQESDDYM